MEVLTMRTWEVNDDSWQSHIWPRSRIQPVQSSLKIPSPYLHPSAIIAPCANAFKMLLELHEMQQKLHNSANWGISKFVYLRLCLLLCFYPRPPRLAIAMKSYIPSNSINWHVWSGCCCFFNGISRLAPILSYWLLRIQVSGPRKYHHSRVHYFLEVRNWSSGLTRVSNTDCWDVSWRTIGSDTLEGVFCVSFNNT